MESNCATKYFKGIVCDEQFKKMLSCAQSGFVHSVFKRCINIQFHNNVYGIVCGQEYAAPYTLNIIENEDLSCLGIEQGEIVTIENNSVIISSKVKIISNAINIYHSKPDKCLVHKQRLKLGISAFDTAINHVRPLNGSAIFYMKYYKNIQMESTIIEQYLASRIKDTIMALKNNSNYKQCLKKIIGIGIGLTPSGDDFVCGLLTAFNVVENEQANHLFHEMSEFLKNNFNILSTTDISLQMIKACLDGSTTYIYKVLIDAFMKSPEEMDHVIKKVLTIGHSSGTDFACGMATGFRIIIDEFIRS